MSGLARLDACRCREADFSLTLKGGPCMVGIPSENPGKKGDHSTVPGHDRFGRARPWGAGLTDGDQAGLVESVQIFFLFLFPFALPLPVPVPGPVAPFDFVRWPGDDMVWALNTDGFEEPSPDAMTRPVTQIQLVHNLISHRAPFHGLEAMLRSVSEVWPWLPRQPEAADPLEQMTGLEHDVDVSIVSVRVIHADGDQRWREDPDAYLGACLDEALAAARELQRAAAMSISETSQPLISRPLLPPVIPCSTLKLHADSSTTACLDLLPNVDSTGWRHFEPPKHDADQERVQAALDTISVGNPFLPVQDRLHDAILSVRSGSYWSGLIHSAAAAEILMHILARSLAWEEGATPEATAKDLDRGNSSMLAFAASHVGKKLGGPWDGTHPGIVRDWKTHIIDKRNRALHAGLPVLETEAKEAVETALALVEFVKGLLVGQRVLPKYPLTATFLISEPGLRTRGRFTRKVRAALGDVPGAAHRFQLWREHLETDPAPRSAPQEDCLLVAVYDPADRSLSWVVHHRSATWAAKAEIVGPLPTLVQDSLNRLLDDFEGSPPPGIIDMVMPGLRGWRQTSPWLPAYRLLPSRACLRTMDDMSEAPNT